MKPRELDSEHCIDLAQKWRRHHINQRGEGTRVADERSYVAKQDPWLGKVRDVTHETSKFVHFIISFVSRTCGGAGPAKETRKGRCGQSFGSGPVRRRQVAQRIVSVVVGATSK